uniref:Mitochondrial assembly of ribosomal large subunit protein 1 n=1 Tax=Pogona vitticeps TaxID=103695 RepID=A0A6J0SP82_9SAUR
MWRRSRGVWPLLQLVAGRPVAGAVGAAGCSRGLRRSAAAGNPLEAAGPGFLRRVTASGLGRFSSLGSSELREAPEGAGGGQEEAPGGGGAGQEPRTQPSPGGPEGPSDPAPSAFTFHDIVSLLRQENASDICVIHLPPELKYSDYFIIVSGSSGRHLHAMAQYLLKMYKYTVKDCRTQVVIEGKDTDDWLCIDFGHTVVHFMLPETREYYELEKLWTLGSHDDQLAQIVSESLPDDFTLGITAEAESLDSA